MTCERCGSERSKQHSIALVDTDSDYLTEGTFRTEVSLRLCEPCVPYVAADMRWYAGELRAQMEYDQEPVGVLKRLAVAWKKWRKVG